MKLRIRDNTIRLRLKRAEVEQIASGQSIVEETHFPESVLTYRLEANGADKVSASFEGGNLAIRIPIDEARQWAQSDQVSIVAEQPIGDSGTLSLLIEKDFMCLSPGHHRPDEDDVDTYAHPEAETGNGC
jgi:hypothetical protein